MDLRTALTSLPTDQLTLMRDGLREMLTGDVQEHEAKAMGEQLEILIEVLQARGA